MGIDDFLERDFYFDKAIKNPYTKELKEHKKTNCKIACASCHKINIYEKVSDNHSKVTYRCQYCGAKI